MENSAKHNRVVDLDGKEHIRRTNSESDVKYKYIRNGIDEYKWWIEDEIKNGNSAGGVRLKRGHETVWEKAVYPTAKLLNALWIETLIGGDTTGAQWIPLDKDGNNTAHFHEIGTL